jgi:hypothetical protein
VHLVDLQDAVKRLALAATGVQAELVVQEHVTMLVRMFCIGKSFAKRKEERYSLPRK